MKKVIITCLTLAFFSALSAQNRETENEKNYIEFDDRKNVVHGVYLGLTQHYGRISDEGAGFTSLKIAYVANRKLEIGVAGTLFYSEQPNYSSIYKGEDILLLGGYGGLHLEPILFGTKFISISFPLLIGAGGATILEKKEDGEYDSDAIEEDNRESNAFFIAEPGVNILYNVSRFVQIETGVRYRFSGDINLPHYGEDNIRGFSFGLGLKIGVFNLGRKKKLKDNF